MFDAAIKNAKEPPKDTPRDRWHDWRNKSIEDL
jgi:hypothetical protein